MKKAKEIKLSKLRKSNSVKNKTSHKTIFKKNKILPQKSKVFDQKSRIWETPTLSTNADSITDTNLKRLRDLSKK